MEKLFYGGATYHQSVGNFAPYYTIGDWRCVPPSLGASCVRNYTEIDGNVSR